MIPPTAVLASAAGLMVAADVPLPVELTAMAMVGLVLRWLIRQDNRKDRDMESRLAALEVEVSEQRHLKHVFINRLTAIRGTLALVRHHARTCSCGAMTPTLSLLEHLLSVDDAAQ